VTIESSFVRANDDCIAIKTFGDESYPGQGPSPGRDVRSIRVTGSVFWNMAWGNALEIGFELRAPSVSGILFQDCDVIHVERGATFSIHNGDAATVSDVRFEDIRVEDSRHKLIDLAVFLSQYSTDRPADREEIRRRYMDGAWDGVLRVTPEQKPVYAASRGHIKGVLFKDIAVVDGGLPFSILSGFDAEHAVEDVALDNLTFHGQPLRDAEQARFFVENARGIRFVAGGPQRAGGSQGSADAPRPPQR
jgi:hypothetical protein